MDPIACSSEITHVVVYARGAWVTRRVTLPETLSPGSIDLAVSGVSPLAEGGGIRVSVTGERQVVCVRTALVIPESPVLEGDLNLRVRALQRARVRLEAKRSQLQARQKTLSDVKVDPRLRGRLKRQDPLRRVKDGLSVVTLVDQLAAQIDSELLTVARALEDNGRELATATLAADQGRTADLTGPGHPHRQLTVQIGPGAGGLTSLEVTYGIPTARWWPAYTAQITTADGRARFSLEAFVAQLSFEDWSNARISLSTADRIQDIRLPELPSMRLGRAQSPKASGYRPPPAGLDALFLGYDQAVVRVTEIRAIEIRQVEIQASVLEDESARALPPSEAASASLEEDEVLFGGAIGGMSLADVSPPPGLEAHSPQAIGAVTGVMRAAMTPASAPAPRAAMHRLSRESRKSQPPEPAPVELEPSDAWLDFDSLRLGPLDNRALRGRLVRKTAATLGTAENAARQEIERLAAPPLSTDPRETRGQFDFRYDAQGAVEVPSNGRCHRVALAAALAPATFRFRAVPREGNEVFREVELENPFPSPLLAGPVEVFVDGALTSTAALSAVDRGGRIALGLGVEERLRVARNARAEESTKGLMGGTTEVEHAVTIDLTSAMGREVEVEVLDRVPVSDEKDLEVALVDAKPTNGKYDQSDRGRPIRGGLLWKVKVAAGGAASVAFRYRVNLPAKSEVVGGNRRE
jgi:hypothetical protein